MNDEPHSQDRRSFLAWASLAAWSGVTVTVTAAGCGDSVDTTTTPSPPPSGAPTTPSPAGGATGTVTANHGHIASLTPQELDGGRALRLDISGDAGHPHTVELSEDELARIASGERIAKPASTLEEDPLYPDVGTHGHSVIFNG